MSTAHPARVWNYWLGGRDYFAADRAAGEQIDREFPHLAQSARAQRAFLVRAVRFLAGPAKIRQFLDIGAGLPAGGNTHEIAQRIAPDTGIVYADNDPVVIMHAKALLGSPMPARMSAGAVSYTDADLRDVAAVLAGGPERSWVAWSGGRVRSAVVVFRHWGGCRLASRGLPFLVVCLAMGARGAALRRLILWSPPVTPARRRARWPSARLPITTAAA